jgi:hypothetical protein
MSKRRKAKSGTSTPEIAPVPAILDPETTRRRRKRRWIFVASVLVAVPVFEAVAYRFRAVEITVVNATEAPIRDLRVEFPGGSFERAQLDPKGGVTHVVRPDYSFSTADFSSYRTTIRLATADGGLVRHNIRISSVDYTARETYTLRPGAPGLPLALDHTTEPGFPLGEIRSLMKRLGLR